MSTEKPSKLEIEKKKYEQAKARYDAVLAREKEKRRKGDTKRKIILGGLLIKTAKDDPQAADLLRVLLSKIARPQDKQAFDGWSLTDER